MSNKEEEFPFEQFVQALQEKGDLRGKLKHIITAICQNNVYWIYSAMSTIVQIIKSKDQQAITKCRSIQIASILLQTCEYSVATFIQVYLLPFLIQTTIFRGKKSYQQLSHYFKQTFNIQLTAQTSKLSLEYVERTVQFIFHAARIKPYRTVQTEELKQQSHFSRAVRIITDKGIEQPKKYKYFDQSKQQQCRKIFLEKLKKFNNFSDEWTQFLVVNLLQEIKTNKKQLLQLRLLVPYGESFLTSAIINFCEQQLLQITDRLDQKKKYLGLLNELVRNGDIQAIILVKNSQFVPTITAHVSKLPGHTGVNAGQNMFPEVKATKQLKKQFYVDFLRSLENWAICLPQLYDSDEFNIKNIWQFLKNQKKFKFPQNLNLARFQKQIKQNLQKNKERNDRLLQILENMDSSKQQSMERPALSKMSNVLQKTTLLAPSQLQIRLDQIKKQLKNLVGDQQISSKAFKNLVNFKDSWITYLQSIDFEGADQNHLQNLINIGEKYVEQIQMIVPLQANLSKKKINFKEFKQNVGQVLDFHDVSQNNLYLKSKQLLKSISIKASKINNSKMGQSKFGKSKIGKSILDKIKGKSKLGDKSKLDLSKAMNRSNMLQKSKYLDKSKSYLQKSKNFDISQKKVNQFIKEDIQQTINIKKNEKDEKELSNEEQNNVPDVEPSIHKYLQIKQNNQIKVKRNSSLVLKKGNSELKSIKQTLKKQIKKQKSQLKHKRQQKSQDEKIVRVADYQIQTLAIKESSNEPRLSQSRDKSQGSRILLRRNNGSRLDKSQQSISRRSASNSIKIKQNSLFKKNQIEHDKTKKISQILEDVNNNRIIRNQTIEVNGNNINQITHTETKNSKMIQERHFNKFSSQVGQISSIHSNSNIKVFHHSAEKILNVTGQISDIKFEKEKEKEKQTKIQYAEYYPKETTMSPLVANVCQSPKIKSKISQSSAQKKLLLNNVEKEQTIQQKEDVPEFKLAFASKTKKNFTKDKFQTQTKIKRQSQNLTETKLGQDQREFRKTTKEIKAQKYLFSNQGARLSVEYYKKSLNSQKAINDKQSNKEQKQKQMEALRQKVLQLQKQSAFMRAKLAAKDNQIRSIKSASKDNSSRGFAQFTSPSNSNYQKSSLRSSSASRRGQQTQFQKQVQSGFKQYLQKIKGNTFRKSLLKSKCLIHKTEQIQIGCLSQRGDKILDSTLYITPHRFDLIQFTVSVIHDSSLKVKIFPEYIKCIPIHKQQKIYLTTEVLKIAFCLPQIEINYKADSQYSSNYHRLTLPLGYNKYCLIEPLDPDIPTQKNIFYVKTDNFKPNTKVLKLQKLSDSFPNFFHIPPIKNRKQNILMATCHYSQSIFNLSLNINQKYAWIEGFLIEGETKVMNFLICTIKQIIQGSRK